MFAALSILPAGISFADSPISHQITLPANQTRCSRLGHTTRALVPVRAAALPTRRALPHQRPILAGCGKGPDRLNACPRCCRKPLILYCGAGVSPANPPFVGLFSAACKTPASRNQRRPLLKRVEQDPRYTTVLQKMRLPSAARNAMYER